MKAGRQGPQAMHCDGVRREVGGEEGARCKGGGCGCAGNYEGHRRGNTRRQ